MSDLEQLQRRLAALRTPAPAPAPLSRPPMHSKEDAGDEALTARLASLEPPTATTQSNPDVSISTNASLDDEVTRFLLSATSPPSSLPPPSTRASNDHRSNAALESYETLAPSFASPIEVAFFNPSSSAGPIRTEDEDAALIRRLQDELSVEESVKKRGGGGGKGGLEGLEERWEAVKGFKVADTAGMVERRLRVERLGGAPDLEGLEELRKRVEKKGRKAKIGRRSDEESGSESEEESDSESGSEKSSDED